ncbi:MAG: LacI family DNA-binding transcriptional regulator [Bacilli bacterium]
MDETTKTSSDINYARTFLYEAIYTQLREDIISGKLLPMDALPKELDLAKSFGVSRITVKRAMQKLVSDGLVVRHRGKGSFVAKGTPSSNRTEPVPITSTAKNIQIGFVVPSFSDTYGMEMLTTLADSALEQGVFFTFFRSRTNQSVEEAAISKLVTLGVDGLIVYPVTNEFYNPMIMRLHLDGFPIVLLDKALQHIPLPTVTSDNYVASYTLTQYLISLGHEKIGYVSFPPEGTSTLNERFKGYVQALNDHGIPRDPTLCHLDMSIIGNYDRDNNQNKEVCFELEQYLNSHPDITAVIGDAWYAELLMKIAESNGRRVPEDLSVASFDPTRGLRTSTHIKQNEVVMAQMAFDLLLRIIRGEEIPQKSIEVPSSLIHGATTGPPSP